jgi:hypothetical protein
VDGKYNESRCTTPLEREKGTLCEHDCNDAASEKEVENIERKQVVYIGAHDVASCTKHLKRETRSLCGR